MAELNIIAADIQAAMQSDESVSLKVQLAAADMAISKQKATKILKHGSVRGKKLTSKQRRFFGARAGGASMKPKGK